MEEKMATWSASALLESLRSGRTSSVELLELYLDRIARLDGPLNAVVTLEPERAREEAESADRALARGDDVGPLHGLPITVKDAIATAGIRSTGGATELAEHLPTVDAPAVVSLRNAGAIVFGKTNLPRWSGDIQTFNDIFGTTRNPWDTERSPGGSSGGAGVALAAGFTSFELGTDIGGSVRVPAHWCGVCSLKTSFGVVPQRGYLDSVTGGDTDADMSVFGPMARSAVDLGLLLKVIAGPEPERALAWRIELPESTVVGLAGCRIGLWLDDRACPIDREYLSLLRGMVDTLDNAGASVSESHPAVDFATQIELFTRLISAAVSPGLPDEVAEASSGSHLAWIRADEHRARLRRVWAEWFLDHDVLLCPVNLSAAVPHDQTGTIWDRTVQIDGVTRSHVEYGSWPGLISVLGLPAAIVPIGRTSAGLPVGVQIVAPFLRDRTAIRVAELIEDLVGGFTAPPGY